MLYALRREGVRVTQVGNWSRHSRNAKGAWLGNAGVMIHHTATSGVHDSVAVCNRGYAGLPGPLCHGVISKEGRVYLVGYGRANHAGLGDSHVLAAVLHGRARPAPKLLDTDGNTLFFGFEVINLGDGRDPVTAAQLDAVVRTSAAICRHKGWGAHRVIGHKEWQKGKIDPRAFSMSVLRSRVARRLATS
ncbi:peptidoglycan recognition family protein [Streptomyces noursei]|uniref:peptidoglycan recognition protein family protein n=1 Tax=Streptomyces noursei TaxID=1971 RepID=UPI00344EA352